MFLQPFLLRQRHLLDHQIFKDSHQFERQRVNTTPLHNTLKRKLSRDKSR